MNLTFVCAIAIVFGVVNSSLLVERDDINELPASKYIDVQTRSSNLLGRIRNLSAEASSVCNICSAFVTDLIEFRKSGANRTSVVEFLTNLCMAILGYIPSVCKTFSETETDVIIYIIDNKNIKPEEVCGVYFQYSGCINPFAKKWTIDIPPHSADSVKLQKSNGNLLNIVQITDVHYDPLYKAGTNAKCDMPLCCEERNGIPTDHQNAAGTFGDYRVCDMSKNSLVDLMTVIRKTQKKIDYVYFTGDIIAHKNWETTKESNLETIQEFYALLLQHFGNITVFPILGNHEAHPCNLYAPLNLQSADKVNTQWLFDAVATYWKNWLPQTALDTVKRGGFYTVLVKSGFRIVALNSNVCFTENFWLFYDDVDPYEQLKWLVEILLEAEKNNEKVHLLSHIPPGEIRCHRQWQYNFNRIVQRFANTISAHFNGHTHVDEFRIYKNESNPSQVVNVAYNGGSFTTFVGLNPDYRVYEIDSTNLMVSDYHQYTFNLSLANSQGSKGPEWYKLYSFKSAYGLKDLDYDSLSDLHERLQSNPQLAKQYVQFHIRESDFAFESGCNATCVESQICHISAVDADGSIKCGEFSIFAQ
ncbi:sphingomyelin phosphodiesterase-like [Coccinella septempunctata]|uniref:sphingomyelin phosphodiesterase-like n=1 Tax=Coccinella septempunctata TaxID=41139 RepID=UPI001D06A8FE|nr:sphingomyelin phosphodiesterase-like [Coccinella septempunctata]